MLTDAELTSIAESPYKSDFPLLTHNPNLTFLDSAATAQRPIAVLDAERRFYETMAQILSSSLAAATAFALSTQIGIAGSIIGAAIGAAASACATQIYKNILNASANKLRSNLSDDGIGPEGTVRMSSSCPKWFVTERIEQTRERFALMTNCP